MKNVISLLFILVAGLFVATNANASCNNYYKVLTHYTNGSSNTFYVYPYNNYYGNAGYYFYYTTSDDTVAQQLDNALAGDKTVYISGNASSCPATGSARNGGIISYSYAYGHS